MAVLALTVFATISAILIVPPLLVEIATDLEISVAVAGQLATATFAAWAVTGVSAGPLSDSFGRRPVALVSLAVLSISMLGCAIAPNLETLFVLRVLAGLGGGVIPPNIVGSVADVISPARRARAVSSLLAIQGLASAISVPLVAVLADVGGWQFAFIVYGGVLVAAFVANWLWLPRDRGERVRNFAYLSRYKALVTLRFFRVAVAVNLTQRIAFWGTLSFFAAYLINTFDLSVGFVALPLAIAANRTDDGQLRRIIRREPEATRADHCRRQFGGRSVLSDRLFRGYGTLGYGGGGDGRNRLPERGVPDSDLRQHRVFGGIQGHRRGPDGFQQSGRRDAGRGDSRDAIGKRRV